MKENRKVIAMLDDYRTMKAQIEALRYELQHAKHISDDEMIRSMTFTHGENVGGSSGHVSDKTLYIAANYHQRIEKVNQGTTGELVGMLTELENATSRLEHYVSLLEPPGSEIICDHYFRGEKWERIAERMGVTTRTVYTLRNRAIENLVRLFSFADQFN